MTGKRGIQIWVPVARGYTFTETRAWVETVSRAIGATRPELVSWEWEVQRRGGLIRLDYTQNAINKTLVAPYSTRPAAGAPVSVPITWDDLDDDRLRPDRWTIHDVQQRLQQAATRWRRSSAASNACLHCEPGPRDMWVGRAVRERWSGQGRVPLRVRVVSEGPAWRR